MENESIILHNFPRNLNKVIQLPASKSISNRLLILEFLSGIDFKLQNLSNADDTQLLKSLLLQIKNNKEEDAVLYCKNAGTVLRFLLSVLSITEGNWTLTGDDAMLQRPLKDLVDSLTQLGAGIEYISKNGFPPISIKGKKLKGADICIQTNLSSQYASSLMLIAPFLENGLRISLKGNISSLPYIEMTKSILERCCLPVEWEKDIIQILPSKITPPTHLSIENDWTAASYFYSAATLGENYSFLLKGLYKNSMQGDGQVLPNLFKQFGIQTEFTSEGVFIQKKENCTLNYFEYDFSNYPDLAQTIAVCCAALKITAKLTGLNSLRIKETDRLNALCTELKKMNIQTSIHENTLEIKPSEIRIEKAIETYSDHRMAMAFAPLACCMPSIEILHPLVVEKSFPHFWEEFLPIEYSTK